MAMGKFDSMKALYAIIPVNIPLPLACGTYTKDPNKHLAKLLWNGE